MPPSSDIVLLGAGRSPHTKWRRRHNRFPKRNFYLGQIQILVNSRIPVDREFLKKYFHEIKKHIEEGVLIVEYKFDKFVDPEELKILAFGSEEERKAYEDEATGKLTERNQELQQTAEERKAEEDERARRSIVGDIPLPGTGAGDTDVSPEGATSEEERYRDGRLSMLSSDNLQGSHEEAFTSPIGKAGALQRETTEANAAGETLLDQTDAEAQAAANSVEATDPSESIEKIVKEDSLSPDQQTTPENEGRSDPVAEAGTDSATADKAAAGSTDVAEAHDDPEYHPDEELGTNAPSDRSDDPNFKPLPDGWKTAAKPELLTYCEERGIDTSDMPSNKVLRQRLNAYLTGA